MGKPTTRQLDGTMSATGALLLLCTVGSANAKGGSQSYNLNTFASLQKNLHSHLSAQNRPSTRNE
jgi:hypothetical protein